MQKGRVCARDAIWKQRASPVVRICWRAKWSEFMFIDFYLLRTLLREGSPMQRDNGRMNISDRAVNFNKNLAAVTN